MDKYFVDINFLKNVNDISSDEDLYYFEDDYANNTATIIQCNEKGYLLITNGID